jgi:hypothetical protein
LAVKQTRLNKSFAYFDRREHALLRSYSLSGDLSIIGVKFYQGAIQSKPVSDQASCSSAAEWI